MERREGIPAERIAEIADNNTIWLNALLWTRPSNALKLQLADTILEWLDDQELLIEDPNAIGNTKILYLSVFKT